jgi:hypothetical protein
MKKKYLFLLYLLIFIKTLIVKEIVSTVFMNLGKAIMKMTHDQLFLTPDSELVYLILHH